MAFGNCCYTCPRGLRDHVSISTRYPVIAGVESGHTSIQCPGDRRGLGNRHTALLAASSVLDTPAVRSDSEA